MTAKNQVGGQVFITGVSSGIGLGLTREFLKQGWTVLGIGRHAPDLGKTDRFRFVSCDLSREREIGPALHRLLGGIEHLDLVILNAGILGQFGDLAEQSLEEMKRVMQVNLWANKVVLDELLGSKRKIDQVIAMSSGASVTASRGWGGYGLSKAALNMLIALAAVEFPETHFAALAPGFVDTAMQDHLCGIHPDQRYPILDRARAARGTNAMPDGDEIAPRLIAVMQRMSDLIPSGTYADIRNAPLVEVAKAQI